MRETGQNARSPAFLVRSYELGIRSFLELGIVDFEFLN